MMLQFTITVRLRYKEIGVYILPCRNSGVSNPLKKIKMGVLHMIICSATDLFTRFIVMIQMAASERGV